MQTTALTTRHRDERHCRTVTSDAHHLPAALPAPSAIVQNGCDVGAIAGYVQGAFVLDVNYHVHATLLEFLQAAESGEEKLRFRWEERGRNLGGSPAHAIRCLGPKISRISLGAVLPATVPNEVNELLGAFDVDTTYVRRSGEPISQSLKLSFDDGKHLLVVSSAADAYDILPPAEGFDVMLINPGSRESRRRILRHLHSRGCGPNGPATIGLIGRGDWDAGDFQLVKHKSCFVFMNEAELGQVVRSVCGSASDAMTNLQSLLTAINGSAIVAVTLGANGSMFMSRQRMVQVAAAHVECKSSVGAGDSFAATTCLSAATAASNHQSCLRGNMEAARVISGLAPAESLQRLDQDVTRHPEMIENRNAL